MVIVIFSFIKYSYLIVTLTKVSFVLRTLINDFKELIRCDTVSIVEGARDFKVLAPPRSVLILIIGNIVFMNFMKAAASGREL